jgi:hypothetical protein
MISRKEWSLKFDVLRKKSGVSTGNIVFGGHLPEWIVDPARMVYHTLRRTILWSNGKLYKRPAVYMQQVEYNNIYYLHKSSPIIGFLDPGVNMVAMSDKLRELFGIPHWSLCRDKDFYFKDFTVVVDGVRYVLTPDDYLYEGLVDGEKYCYTQM